MRREFIGFVVLVVVFAILSLLFFPNWLWLLIILVPLVVLGLRDMFQTKHAILRNFPVVGHFRYMFETIRPEIQQYFVESDTDGVPFDRDQLNHLPAGQKRA